MVEREDFELMRQAKKSKLHYLYWIIYTCATVYAFIITMCYWLLVHDPGKWKPSLFRYLYRERVLKACYNPSESRGTTKGSQN